MKNNTMPKQAMAGLVAGLLLASLTPIITRYFTLPDSMQGFLIGLGLTLEFIALVKIQRSKKGVQKCSVRSAWIIK